MSQSSAAKWWAVAVVGALIALLVVWLRPNHTPPAETPPAPEPKAEPAAPPPPAPRPSPAPPPVQAPPASADPGPGDLPPPSPDQVKPRPVQRGSTPEEQRETQKAAQELLENGIVHLENERRQAEQTGDTETARRDQLRIERMRKRLEVLKQQAAQAP